MKLASLKSNKRDGELIVVDKMLEKAVKVPEIAGNLQEVMDSWDDKAPQLEEIYQALNQGTVEGTFPLNFTDLASPLPRAYQWLDGSAYLSHVRRVRQARGAEMPPSFLTDPLMYQGGSDTFLGPRDDICIKDEAWGIDCEGEIVVVTDDVPEGITATDAISHIKLIMLVNDVSLRNLIPAELAKGFGFMHAKPSSAFSPVAVTPDELGDAWADAKVHLPLVTKINNVLLGAPNAGEDMQFNFAELIAHACKTRALSAGTLLGSGTISNEDETKGGSCLAEKRVLEVIKKGQPETPFLKFGDIVSIDMRDKANQSIFGEISQKVKPRR